MRNPIAWRIYDWLGRQHVGLVSVDLISMELQIERETVNRIAVHMMRYGVVDLHHDAIRLHANSEEAEEAMIDTFGDRPPTAPHPPMKPVSIWDYADRCK
jgi:DNA-binding IclR family transcriptional regulator